MRQIDFNFFERFYPIINYDGDFARDLFKMFKVDLSNLDNNIIEYRTVVQGETLQSIALDLYDTQDYWWVIAVVNGIVDPFYDFPKNQQSIFMDVLKVNSGSYVNVDYEARMAANDAKRQIRVIKNEFVSKFVNDMLAAMKSI